MSLWENYIVYLITSHSFSQVYNPLSQNYTPDNLPTPYKSIHFFLGRSGFFGESTALIASSNTLLRPFWVRAEHSKYSTAFISLAICIPLAVVRGLSFFSFSFSIVSLSSRRSVLVPTRMMGIPGQWWLTSGNH